MTFLSQEDINNAISNAKTEITSAYTTAINNAKSDLTTSYTQAINDSSQILTKNINAVDNKLTEAKTNINTVSQKIDTTMNTHKKNIKDTITGAMTNLTEGA